MFRNFLFNNYRYHSNVISYFPLFSEGESSHDGPPDRPVESIQSSQVCGGAHLGLHVRGGYRSNTRLAEMHCHSLGLGKPRTARAEAAIG